MQLRRNASLFKCYVLMLVSFAKLPGCAEILHPFAARGNRISSLGTDNKRVSRAATASSETLMLHKDDKGGIPNFRFFFPLAIPLCCDALCISSTSC